MPGSSDCMSCRAVLGLYNLEIGSTRPELFSVLTLVRVRFFIRFRTRRLRDGIISIKNHTLPVLLGINAQHSMAWHIDSGWNPAKAPIKFNAIIGNRKVLHRNRGDIQDDLTILDETLGYLYFLGVGIDQNIGRAIVFQNPFV